jgi:hypothetical protein
MMFNKTHQEGSALISALDRNYFSLDEQPYRVTKVPIVSGANIYDKIVVKKIYRRTREILGQIGIDSSRIDL